MATLRAFANRSKLSDSSKDDFEFLAVASKISSSVSHLDKHSLSKGSAILEGGSERKSIEKINIGLPPTGT